MKQNQRVLHFSLTGPSKFFTQQQIYQNSNLTHFDRSSRNLQQISETKSFRPKTAHQIEMIGKTRELTRPILELSIESLFSISPHIDGCSLFSMTPLTKTFPKWKFPHFEKFELERDPSLVSQSFKHFREVEKHLTCQIMVGDVC